MANPMRFALVHTVGGLFILIGKLFMILFTVFICYEILINAEAYEDVSNPFLPCIFVFLIAYAVSNIFMMIYGSAIDAVFICFLYDEE